MKLREGHRGIDDLTDEEAEMIAEELYALDCVKMLFIRQSKRKQMDITGSYPIGNQTSNYIFLGPVNRVLNHEGECPIGIDYELKYPIPADVYEYARGA